MRVARARRTLGAGACLILFAACAENTPRGDDRRRQEAAAEGKGMSDWSNLTVNAMIDKYGPPTRVETDRLVWENRGPWKRIVVRDGLGFLENDRVSSNLEQTIVYAVPPGKRDEVESFSLGLSVSSDGAELSARSTDEERNFLMLNLADDVVNGRLSPEGARVGYFHALQLAQSGKSTPSMHALLFR